MTRPPRQFPPRVAFLSDRQNPARALYNRKFENLLLKSLLT